MPETSGAGSSAPKFPSFVIPTELARIADRAFSLGDGSLDGATRAKAHRLGFAILGAACDLMRAETERADREIALGAYVAGTLPLSALGPIAAEPGATMASLAAGFAKVSDAGIPMARAIDATATAVAPGASGSGTLVLGPGSRGLRPAESGS